MSDSESPANPPDRPPSGRVVVTGCGLVTPAGLTVEENWSAIVAGHSAIRPISAFDLSAFPTPLGGEVQRLDARSYVRNQRTIRFLRKDVIYSLASAKLACEESRVDFSAVEPSRVGLYVGSGEPETRYDQFFPALDSSMNDDGQVDCKHFGSRGLHRIYPSFLLFDLFNNGLCYLSIEYGLTGANNNFTYGAAGGNAIGEAFKAIQRGELDVALAGGHDSLVSCFENHFLYAATGMVTHETDPRLAMKPYSAGRDGFAPSEGAGFVVLEDLHRAVARNADIRGEIVGYRCNCDPDQDIIPTEPRPEAVTSAITLALGDAGIEPARVDYIQSDGNATKADDLRETRAFKQVFGKRAHDIPVSGVKPVIGHLGAAASAAELIIACLALEDGVIPPTTNCLGGDPECDLDYVPGASRTKDMQYAVSVNKGIGGQNCIFVLKRYTEA